MVRPYVIARNRELTMEITVDLLLGVLFSALVFGFVYLFAWFLLSRYASWLPEAVVGLYALVAFGSAWFAVDPLRGHKPLSVGEEAVLMAGLSSSAIPAVSRLTIPGFAEVLIAGPRNLIDALRAFMHRLPTRRAVLDDADALLHAAAKEAPLHDDASPLALSILRRLQLAKIRMKNGTQPILVLTERGRDALHGNGPR